MTGRSSRRRPWPTVSAAILTSCLLLVAACSRGGAGEASDPASSADDVSGPVAIDGSFLSDDDPGADPFAPGPAGGPTGEVGQLITLANTAAEDAAAGTGGDGSGAPGGDEADDVARAVLAARRDASVAVFTDAGEPLIRPRSSAGVAVAPARREPACDAGDLARRLDAAGAAEAFAGIAGIEEFELLDHLEGLTAGYLIDQALVVNHRFRDGHAVAFRSILAPGSAVLVDDDGLPRVRCRSAAPLLPAWFEVEDLLLPITAFADRVVEAEIGADAPVSPFTSIDGTFTDDPDDALGPPDEVAVSLGDDPAGPDGTDGTDGGDGATATTGPGTGEGTSDPDDGEPATTAGAGDDSDDTSGPDEDPGAGTTGPGDGDGAAGSCGNRILVEFDDNRLVDGPGPDLQILEQGEPEATYVAVGVDADDLRPLGTVPGGSATIDLSEVAEPGDEFRFVELCDGPDASTEVPGSDIDAVAALHSVAPGR